MLADPGVRQAMEQQVGACRARGGFTAGLGQHAISVFGLIVACTSLACCDWASPAACADVCGAVDAGGAGPDGRHAGGQPNVPEVGAALLCCRAALLCCTFQGLWGTRHCSPAIPCTELLHRRHFLPSCTHLLNLLKPPFPLPVQHAGRQPCGSVGDARDHDGPAGASCCCCPWLPPPAQPARTRTQNVHTVRFKGHALRRRSALTTATPSPTPPRSG